ncbi:formate dehydrogenase subunit delta [Thalassotalea fonticola]|uniref:Formate dehydrogenase subunit delta n=1 Tax=Thalassotalea fonticola TaxID=3065649 RepID=A0ABZ0GNA0_9GAMM|nr:formate dehydrogenase subunit delta [Colwelliaceae bacterium S1-1]
MSDDRLKYVVDMANQIALNLLHGKEQQQCVIEISHHINRFWAPSMRAQLAEAANHDNYQLDDMVILALREIKND